MPWAGLLRIEEEPQTFDCYLLLPPQRAVPFECGHCNNALFVQLCGDVTDVLEHDTPQCTFHTLTSMYMA